MNKDNRRIKPANIARCDKKIEDNYTQNLKEVNGQVINPNQLFFAAEAKKAIEKDDDNKADGSKSKGDATIERGLLD